MASIELTTTATVPTSTSLTITVYEDVGNDGSGASTDPNGKAYDNSASQSVADGTNTYSLSGFDGGSGNAYWINVEPDNSDVTVTASLDSATVDVLTEQTISAPVTQLTSDTPLPGVAAGSVSITMPETVLSAVSPLPGVVPGSVTLDAPTTTLTATTPLADLFGPPANLATTVVSPTQIDLSWEDAGDEDTYLIWRRELFRDGYGQWRQRATLAANTTTYSDGTHPDTTYQHYVEAKRNSLSTTSNEVETTSSDDGVRTDRVPASGPYLVVEGPNGAVYQPTIVGEPSVNETLNGLPTVEVPVEKSERWSDTQQWEGQPMRAYLDGDRLPIEEVETTTQEPDRSILVGVGGVELRERVQKDVVSQDAHLAAEDVIQTTSYTAHVDDPASTTSDNVLQESVDSQTEWTDALNATIDSTDIYDVINGYLQTRQTAHFGEAENASYQNGSEIIETDSSRWSGGKVIDFDLSGLDVYLDASFTTDHDIPEADVGVAVRTQQPGDGHVGFNIELDGTVLEDIGADVLTTGETSPDWFIANMSNWSGTLSEGSHTVTINFDESSSASDPSVYIDCISLYDKSATPGFTENVTSNVLEGPDLHPSGVQVQTADIVTVRQVVGGRLETAFNKVNGSQAIALSNDQGGTWPISASNAENVEGSFGSGSSTLRARFTFGGYDSDTTTSPAGRKSPHKADLYRLYADLNDTPLLANRSFDNSGINVLNEIASYGDFIWEVVWDESIPGLAVEWTQPGQRTASVDPSLVDYSVETDYSSIVRKAVIKGTLVPVRNEQFSVSQLDTWEDVLANNYLAEVGERVSDGAGTTFERGVDYELRPNTGEVKLLSSGSMSTGTTYEIDYERHIIGSYEASDYDGTHPVLVEELPAVTTSRNADQAALIAVKSAGEPIQRASVTIDKQPTGLTLVEAIDLDLLSTDNPLEIWSLNDSARQVALQLGSRDAIEETLSEFNRRLAAVTGKV